MSTIKSSDEHLTLNADGSSKDIKFQANGVEKASISSAGAFTSTTIDATKLTGNLPAISGAALTSLPADSTKLPLAGGTLSGDLTFSNSDPVISGSSGNMKISAEDSLVIEMDNNSQNTGGEAIIVKTDPNTTCLTMKENGVSLFGTGVVTPSYNGIVTIGSQGTGVLLECKVSHTTAFGAVKFINDNGEVGSISVLGSSVAYNTSSDYRLKENVDYDWDATARLKQLKPARFNFIADNTNTLVDGFIAHEVQDIVPEAVSGEKDAMTAEVLYAEGDELPEGKSVGDIKTAAAINPQGIDQSKLVPLLVKTIQELEARITALES